MICRNCPTEIGRRNKSGLCLPCVRKVPHSEETRARRSASIQRKYATDPAFRARQKASAGCKTDKGRASLSEHAKRRNLSQIGRSHWTDETHRKRAEALRNHYLAHIPSEYRPLYVTLRKEHRMPAADCLAAVMQQVEADRARIRRELMAA